MSLISTSAARELGAGLRALRNAAGLTTRATAEAIGTSSANISSWENAARLISEERLGLILDALQASPDERERLMGLRRQAEGPGELVAGAAIEVPLARLIEQEQNARRITEASLALIPGLLQTRSYARAILRRYPNVDTLLTLRMGRRSLLEGSNPVEFHALIDDEMLTRPIAPPSAMRDQLQHLVAMAERPNVTIQLVPSTTPGYLPHLIGGFILLEFATASPVVHLEHYDASTSLWEERQVRRYIEAAEEIKQAAMTPERTAEVIAEMVHGMET